MQSDRSSDAPIDVETVQEDDPGSHQAADVKVEYIDPGSHQMADVKVEYIEQWCLFQSEKNH